MQNSYFTQLIGVLLTILGLVALTTSAYLYGIPLSGKEKQRAGKQWTNKGNVRRLPINLETMAGAIFLLGGIGILNWTNFEFCSFLAYWLPDLPDGIKLLLSCR